MKTLWAAALFAMTATAWTFEGDWSAWDTPQGAGAPKVDEIRPLGTPGYDGTPGYGTGNPSSYELRSLGRSESRWMGTPAGATPTLADRKGMSRFDGMRLLGRAEAHPIDRSSPTAAYLESARAAAGGTTEGRELGCNLVEANRELGRDEARDTGEQAGGSAEPPTTWQMDQDSELKAAAAAAGKPDC